jgi:hypothetical protein
MFMNVHEGTHLEMKMVILKQHLLYSEVCLSALHISNYLIITKPSEAGTFIITILKSMKMRHRDII